MPRKKSTKGRAKVRNIQGAIKLQAIKINKRLRSLKKGKNLGKYTSKELLNYVSRTRGVKLVKSKSSGNLRVALNKIAQTYQQYMDIRKTFQKFLASHALSNIGIAEIRAKTRESLKKTLGEEIGRKATDEDVDRFYEVVTHINKAKDESLLSKVDPSDFNKLVIDAKEEHWGVDRFVNALGSLANIMDINDISNLHYRREAVDLYHRYIV